MRFIRPVVVLLVVVLVGWTPAKASLAMVGASKDNTLYEDPAGTLSNGLGSFLFTGKTAQGLTRRALMAFDLAGALPAGSTITAVSLTLHLSMTATGAQNIGLHRLLSNWGEGASHGTGTEATGALAAPGDATWIHTFFDSMLWTSPGGDFDPLASAVLSVGAVGSYTWSSATMIADVQHWLDHPSANFGWLVLGNESASGTAKRFDSRQNETAEFRPVLMIEYTTVPAPAAGMILAGPWFAFRRRR